MCGGKFGASHTQLVSLMTSSASPPGSPIDISNRHTQNQTDLPPPQTHSSCNIPLPFARMKNLSHSWHFSFSYLLAQSGRLVGSTFPTDPESNLFIRFHLYCNGLLKDLPTFSLTLHSSQYSSQRGPVVSPLCLKPSSDAPVLLKNPNPRSGLRAM